VGFALALRALVPLAAAADETGDGAGSARQAGEDRWVASFAITSGVFVQKQKGSAESSLLEGGTPPAVELQEPVNGHDITVTPFVGGSVELMSPALPIPTRPRFFLGAGLLPALGTERTVAVAGDPDCIRGPEPGVPCTRDETEPRGISFGETSANGQGSKVETEFDALTYNASFGVAFPLRIGERQVRIKPSFGWTHYKVTGKGLVVDAACQPVSQCTDKLLFGSLILPGFLRETTLVGKKSQRFNGIGPGLDVEVDTTRYGPIGVSLFAGAHAYYILENRKFKFGTTQAFDDPVGMDTANANFEVRVNQWIYRGDVGIRFHWLGRD